MPNRFTGVKVAYNTLTLYFNPVTGNPVAGFDHFSFVPQVLNSSTPNSDYPLLVFAVDTSGRILNNNDAINSTPDTGPGHTRPATPHVQFSIINLYYEQLRVLYPIGSAIQSELRVYPHNFVGSTQFMAYTAETDNTKLVGNLEELIAGSLNPSPPRNAIRSF